VTTNTTEPVTMISRATNIALCMLNVAGCDQDNSDGIDRRSYNLGIIGAFSEVVRLGVKKLALSEVLTPDEMNDLIADAKIIATRNEVKLYREAELLQSDLYPADVAAGKDVLLIYAGGTLDEYLALKAEKLRLVSDGAYHAAARRDIAVRFGRLLSYPDSVIDELIERNSAEPPQ
jgi:hypothetical protein